ncbi:glyoxylase-like metal-dependent hydrolase (beta-lactamase superfamily II) [Allocatelliglobosispora scoriae]|uniref:Glyoxylase-like metal-dependent hydrolase (Beta-lactamase superfamily II) n=1 Tax=Allocatelliglobosispora scoriae TaxID=643052 RepID=A0A841BK25_9ACTN|nr:MBL fold metallo-hydrolase [Allocatelliglobosispora scoriae]MBB5867566.1 glyoxylase-like metal-dependent hydrolase (beta-lactamase superfamily II) [Allocatelliglobosispora scoriae]
MIMDRDGHPSSRRTFLGVVAAAAAVPSVGILLPGAAHAQPPAGLPDYLPIPAGAAGPALNADGYHVGRINGHLHWVTDGFYQAMFLSTRSGVVLVDAPPTIGHNLLRAIEEVTRANGRPRRVTHLVYSHSHADHIGAADIFGPHVERIAHAETRRLLRVARDPHRPDPTVTFEDRYVLRVGGERLELDYHGPNHSPDNIFIYAPDHATLMVVDVLYPGWVPFKNLAVSHEVPAWVRMHRVAMDYPWTTLVGGHLGRLGVRADGDVQRHYIADLEASARSTLASLDPTPFFEKYSPSGNSWAVFKAYLDEAARLAAAPVVAKYAGKLAAVDVFTVDNAFAMIESVRIDLGVLGPFGIRP